MNPLVDFLTFQSMAYTIGISASQSLYTTVEGGKTTHGGLYIKKSTGIGVPVLKKNFLNF